MSEAISFGVVSLTVILVLFLYAISGAFFEYKHFHLIHETGLGIILGALSGGLFYLLFQDTLHSLYNFNGQFFFYILLPIIVFCGGYNLNKKRFAENFFYIALFGIIGTIITFVFIIVFTYFISEYELIIVSFSDEVIKLSFENILIFAATICASDCVAALTMIKPEKYPKLFSVVFGEGMVNDAISIILFISAELISKSNSGGWLIPIELTFLFLLEFAGSSLIGWIIGAFTSLLFKKLRFLTKSAILEICIILYMGYACFAICDLVELSGVISVMVCGVVLAHYNFYNLSKIGQISSQVTLNSFSLLCESFVYVYLGLALWAIPGDIESGRETLKTSWIFFLLQLGVGFLSRAITLFFLTLLCQLIMGKKKFRLSFWELNIIWFAGLIRGSVAYALIQKFISTEETKYQIEIMQTTVLFLVIFSTIVLGGLMPLYIVANLKVHEKRLKQTKLFDSNITGIESIRVNMLGEIEGGLGEDIEIKIEKKKSKFYKFCQNLEENYLKKLLIYDYENRKADIKLEKKLAKSFNEEENNRKTMTFQPINETIESVSSLNKVSKVLYRSTINSKFMGTQDVIMSIDVPTEQIIYQIDENNKLQKSQIKNIDQQILENSEKHLDFYEKQ